MRMVPAVLLLLSLFLLFAVDDGTHHIPTRRQLMEDLNAWDGILELIGNSIGPINTEIEYLYSKTRRRANELKFKRHLRAPSFVLWRPIQELLARTGMDRPGTHLNSFVGQCATAGRYGDIFYAFIVDAVHRRAQETQFPIVCNF